MTDENADLDPLAFNLIVTKSGGAIVLNWIGKCPQNEKFVKSLMELPPEQIGNAIVIFAFDCFENLFMSPDWWEKLSSPEKNNLTERIFCGIKKDHTGQCLKIDGNKYVSWEIDAVESNLAI